MWDGEFRPLGWDMVPTPLLGMDVDEDENRVVEVVDDVVLYSG